MSYIDTLGQWLLPALEHFHYTGYWLAFPAALLETSLVAGWFFPVELFLGLILGLFLLLLWVINLGRKLGPQSWHLLRSLWHSISEAIASNPEMQRIAGKHQRVLGFLKRRLDKTRFNGLPLTLLGLAFFYVVLLFAGIVEDLLTSDPVVFLDHGLAQIITLVRTPEIIQVFLWITVLGSPQMVFPLLALVTVLLWINRQQWVIPGLLLSFSGGLGFTLLGKLVFHRPRPAAAVIMEHSYSFPSAHATLAVALYGFLAYLLIRRAGNWQWRVNWLFAGGLLALFIGLSRIVLGVHYLSDVWAGYLVGALWLIVGISLTECLRFKGKIPPPKTMEPRRRILNGVIIFLMCVIYLLVASTYQPPVRQAKPDTSEALNGDIIAVLQEKLLVYTRQENTFRESTGSFCGGWTRIWTQPRSVC